MTCACSFRASPCVHMGVPRQMVSDSVLLTREVFDITVEFLYVYGPSAQASSVKPSSRKSLHAQARAAWSVRTVSLRPCRYCLNVSVAHTRARYSKISFILWDHACIYGGSQPGSEPGWSAHYWYFSVDSGAEDWAAFPRY